MLPSFRGHDARRNLHENPIPSATPMSEPEIMHPSMQLAPFAL